MSKMSKLTVSLLLVAVIALAFGAGFQFGRNSKQLSQGLVHPSPTSSVFRLLVR